MTAFAPARVMDTLRQTALLLRALLRGVSAEQAQHAADGAWNVPAILQHMLEYEQVVQERIRVILAADRPVLPATDNERIAAGDAPPAALLDQIVRARLETLGMAQRLGDAQWQRRGIHPAYGEISLSEVLLNTVLHDVAHLDQISRALGLAEPIR